MNTVIVLYMYCTCTHTVQHTSSFTVESDLLIFLHDHLGGMEGWRDGWGEGGREGGGEGGEERREGGGEGGEERMG